MALWKFGHFKLVSKISRKLFELGAWNLGILCRLPVKRLSKLQNFLWNYGIANSAMFRDKQMLDIVFYKHQL